MEYENGMETIEEKQNMRAFIHWLCYKPAKHIFKGLSTGEVKVNQEAEW